MEEFPESSDPEVQGKDEQHDHEESRLARVCERALRGILRSAETEETQGEYLMTQRGWRKVAFQFELSA